MNQFTGTVALENPERSERMRIILPSDLYPSMLISLAALLLTLRSIVRSRLDLQLENLALRHMHESAEVLNFGESPA